MLTAEEINIRDPFVLVHDGTYFLYGTRGATCWGEATGFDVYYGTDLKEWKGPVSCFENDGTFWATRNYWAPEVHVWQGKFYMFASFKSDERRRGTAILRSDSPMGPFMPWSDGPLTPPEWECLDGTFFVDEQKPYMVFCHEWVQAGDGEIWAMPLSGDLKRREGEMRLLFRASWADWAKEISHSSGMKGYVTDGPFLWRDKEKRLLCLWSSFSESGYTQGLAVSDNGRITGNFTQLEPLFVGNGGHGMLFQDKAGKTWLTLHAPNTHLEERPRFYSVPDFL